MTADEDLYRALRGRLFGIAYRLLGSAVEAEDVVQDAFLRLVDARRAGDEIESPTGFLVTVTTRLGIDRLRSARVRREQYPGQWLPEPVSELPDDDPAASAETADSISLAFLLVLERLGPVERAVFVLRDVFDYGYDEIGRIVDRSAASCRQIALRARTRVEGRKRFAVDAGTARRRGGELRPRLERRGHRGPARAARAGRRARRRRRRQGARAAAAARGR